MPTLTLSELGWSSFFEAGFRGLRREGCEPARVAQENRGGYRVLTAAGEMEAELTGKLRFEAASRGALPAVGDWVVVQARPAEGRATIHAVLPRRSKFSRQAAGNQGGEQVVAANVDVVFLVTSLDQDLSLRRIERYLTLIWESGARPVVLLSKADLCLEPVEAAVARVRAAAPGVPVYAVSAASADACVGLESIREQLGIGHTAALIGSSGVGKSTLINRLVGAERQATQEVRGEDGRGRHTTTSRELVPLPGGGLLIDTPGMRELQLCDAGVGLEQTFADVEAVARGCRFRDCAHGTEPGCRVRAALQAGTLDGARLEHYQKLQGELAARTRREGALSRRSEKRRARRIPTTGPGGAGPGRRHRPCEGEER